MIGDDIVTLTDDGSLSQKGYFGLKVWISAQTQDEAVVVVYSELQSDRFRAII